MQVKTDVLNRNDIENFLLKFYEKVFTDDLIGHFFTQVVPLNLEVHIPIIADFWESVVFSTHAYRKNVMGVHQHIHQLSAIKKEHLNQWVHLFVQTIDERYEGTNTELMKQRARSVASLMDIKLNHGGIKLP